MGVDDMNEALEAGFLDGKLCNPVTVKFNDNTNQAIETYKPYSVPANNTPDFLGLATIALVKCIGSIPLVILVQVAP